MQYACIHLVNAKQLTLLNCQHACTQHATPYYRTKIDSITMSIPINYSWIHCSGCGYLDIIYIG